MTVHVHQAALALNIELPADGRVPGSVELIPPGRDVQGRDGRRWINDAPQMIVDAFQRQGMPVPLDWEHSTEKAAPLGRPAPAAGWIESLLARLDGSIWGQVAWTPQGAESVKNREYRYISPAFAFEKHTRRILMIVSAALTNRPNLPLTALNQAQRQAAQDYGLSAEEIAVCRAFNLSPEDFKKNL